MPTISPERWYAEIEASTGQLAAIVHGGDPSLHIPACPDWDLRQLATHVGRVQRWAAEITSTRSGSFIPFRSVPDGESPDDPAAQAAWLRAGAQRVIGAVRAAGGDRVWGFGAMVPAAFWARRMCHETLVHRADAQLAAGQQPVIAADVAADAIDEWLSRPFGGDPDPRAAALPAGRVLHVHATDERLAGAGEWTVRHEAGGIEIEAGHARGDVAVRGPAGRLLLVLLGRLRPDDPAVSVAGDAGLLARWLAGTPF